MSCLCVCCEVSTKARVLCGVHVSVSVHNIYGQCIIYISPMCTYNIYIANILCNMRGAKQKFVFQLANPRLIFFLGFRAKCQVFVLRVHAPATTHYVFRRCVYTQSRAGRLPAVIFLRVDGFFFNMILHGRVAFHIASRHSFVLDSLFSENFRNFGNRLHSTMSIERYFE